jgi:hypothetical protein
MNTETLLYKDWITYFEDDSLKIEFDNYPVVRDIQIYPDMTKDEKKEILKKPFILEKGLWLKVTYKEELPYSFFIPSGYRWDGATIPFGLYNLIGSPSDTRFKIASMVHDFLCENHYVIQNNRYLSTKIFDGLLAEVGVVKWKRFLMFHAIDNFQKIKGHWGVNKK